MCGIAGLLVAREGDVASRAGAMGRAIAHRGPDGEGVWSDASAGVALAHRRLSIVDLTPTGAQPMVSADGRWVISYNGEIYNADAMARAMPDLVRRGTSDTEVILESVSRRGVDRTLADMNGMFAIALWDRAKRTLHLVRDRMGIKPLFYAEREKGFYFASELKCFEAVGLRFDIDPKAVASFLRFGYVPAPHCIFSRVHKVRPGEIVTLQAGVAPQTRCYWNLEAVADEGLAHPFAGSDAEAIDALDELLRDAVSAHMISDVPLGAFLSGGIDSSTVVALMKAAQRGPVRTFSIGFPELGFDESAHARAVARHLDTEHEELTVTAAAALSIVPDLADMYDEPFADSSQIPTYAISKMTRAHVTVALSGDGGDELFAGYNRYVLAAGRLAWLQRVPAALRHTAAAALDALPGGIADFAAQAVPARLRPAQPADKVRKLAEVLRLDGDAVYLRLVSQCPNPASLTAGFGEHPIRMDWRASAADLLLERMQVFDTASYLPDDILQKVDRASMAVALEVRPPLLDHRVVEFAARLPRHMRMRNGETKWLLRRVLDRYVPRELIDRPKMGFGIPLAAWLRGPLRDWAENLLDPQHLGGGLLDVAAVRRLWFEHVGGGRNWAYALWTVLMFEAWRRRWCESAPIRRIGEAAVVGTI